MVLTAAALKAQAASLGFDLCGIARAERFPELAFFREWLDRGYAGNMGWLNRTARKRMDPAVAIPGARSVIMLGTVYNTDRPYSTEVADPRAARISRYAWGDDYHDVLRARLARLHDWMHDVEPGDFVARYYADTGPVSERTFAQRAGLGFIGKNACVINPGLGSWIFLSAILTTLEFPPDEPAVDQCGSCTLCLEACPTGAIVEPRVVDSTRCLSYLTIEEQGDIPEALQDAVGSHVYGCDVCQDVCPFNHAPAVSRDPAWQPRPGLDGARTIDLWRMPDRALRRLVKGTPMTHAKFPMVRRNLALALQASGDPEDAAALAEPADERPSATHPLVQRHIRMKA